MKKLVKKKWNTFVLSRVCQAIRDWTGRDPLGFPMCSTAERNLLNVVKRQISGLQATRGTTDDYLEAYDVIEKTALKTWPELRNTYKRAQ